MRRRPRSITSCNCSLCRRYGAIWAYYTRKGLDYHFAPDDIVAYAWGREALEFLRCVRCGCVTHWEWRTKRGGDTRVGVNVRNVEPAELDGVPLRKLDGAHSWKTLPRWKHRWA